MSTVYILYSIMQVLSFDLSKVERMCGKYPDCLFSLDHLKVTQPWRHYLAPYRSRPPPPLPPSTPPSQPLPSGLTTYSFFMQRKWLRGTNLCLRLVRVYPINGRKIFVVEFIDEIWYKDVLWLEINKTRCCYHFKLILFFPFILFFG